MVARELISDSIPPLRTSDTVKKALDRMAEFRVNHLPVVNDEQFLGLVSEDDLIGVTDYGEPIGSLNLSLYNAFVEEEQHIYDVIRQVYLLKLSMVPVLDPSKNYLGVISMNSLVEYMATLTSVKEPGGIIVLEISNRSNSLAHMAQIVESNNAQVLSSYIRTFPDSTRLEVTLKISRTDLSSVVASFLRYDYTIIATYNDIKGYDATLDRYDQLMNYLSL
ncbi:CBS domain-containing protein [Hufsiella ginkgonis]|uniref:CBS domain-containing protein n=1 Tax=Hufsiella ginkgonis TaxID=2695274 RepID=A0A7K1Y407_9SPHI|nr:CBS domain-containing protein [Hufsiella ginkgonis]MXV17789.1 CBS domain-containing protein [Hufsiella ginkgonis]